MEAVASLLSSGDSALVPGKDSVAGSHGFLEADTNTDPDWENQIRASLESGARVDEEFNALNLKQQQEELDFNKTKSELQKKRDEAIKQHRALLEKLESVRVKLQLNNSKATRKNFMSKIQEATAERDRCLEERDRLSAALAQEEEQLSSLQQEQADEMRQWDQELSELRSQTELAQKESKEATSRAQRDERAAVERERDTTNERIQSWLNQVNVYLSGLKTDLPLRHSQEKPIWEKRDGEVRQSQQQLQAKFSEILQSLERGQQLQSLSQVRAPSLPQVPMAELYFHRLMQMRPRPPAPPHTTMPPPHPTMPPPHAAMAGPIMTMAPPHTAIAPPHATLSPPPNGIAVPHVVMAPPHATMAPPHVTMTPLPHPLLPLAPPHILVGPPLLRPHPPLLPTPPLPAVFPPHHRPPFATTPLPAPATPPKPQTPPPKPQTPPPAALGTLGKLLEKLKAQFPQSSIVELTRLLQQVKTERGTLAGLSMEDVIEKVKEKVEESSSAAEVQKKTCLVCQKSVEPGTDLELSCAHVVHKDCVKLWRKSSKSSSCPFCPNK